MKYEMRMEAPRSLGAGADLLQVTGTVKAGVSAWWQALSFFVFGCIMAGSSAFGQAIQAGGNNRPDTVLNSGVCGSTGILSWLTGTKLIATFFAIGLVSYFIGRAVGRNGAQDGLITMGIAVLGLAAIKAIISIFVAGC